jgi:hypothetical protein
MRKMKTISYKFLYWLFESIFFLSIGVKIIMLVIEFQHIVDDGYDSNYNIGLIRTDYLVEPNPEKIAIHAKSTLLTSPYLVTDQWTINFNSKEKSIKSALVMASIVKLFYLYLILFILRRFVLSLKSETPFTQKNVWRLQTIGFLILIIPLLELIGSFIAKNWIFSHFYLQTKTYSIPYEVGYSIGYNLAKSGLVSPWILTGLLILVIAEVFRQGVKIKQEQDLTI